MTLPGTYSISSRSSSRIYGMCVKSWTVFSSASIKSSFIISPRCSPLCLPKPSHIGLNGLSSFFCYSLCYSSCYLLSSSYFCFSSYLFFSAYFFFSSYYFFILSICFYKSAILAASLSSSENLLARDPTFNTDSMLSKVC